MGSTPIQPKSALQDDPASLDVYEKLRGDVLSGFLKPGTKVPIEALCKRYGTSQSPIRESLNRLASEGLIDRADRRGFFVASVDIHKLHELMQTRCWLEERALRESLANRTPQWEEQLVVSLHWLSRCQRYSDEERRIVNPEWDVRHKSFHLALISACGSSILLRYCRELRDRWDSYRFMAESAHPVPFARRPDEHRMIVETVLDGDVEQAVSLLITHYRTSYELVRLHFEA